MEGIRFIFVKSRGYVFSDFDFNNLFREESWSFACLINSWFFLFGSNDSHPMAIGSHEAIQT